MMYFESGIQNSIGAELFFKLLKLRANFYIPNGTDYAIEISKINNNKTASLTHQ